MIFLANTSNGFAQDNRDKARQALDNGSAYLRDFKPIESLRAFDSAIIFARRSNDKYLEASGLLGAGQARWYSSNFRGGIDTIGRAIALFRSLNSQDQDIRYQLLTALRIISNIYHAVGDYEKAFNAASESLAMNRLDKPNRILSLIQMGALYKSMKDYPTAMTYFLEAEQHAPTPRSYEYRELHTQRGLLHAERSSFDSAMDSYQKALPGHPIPKNVHLRIGECYILQGQFDSAYEYLNAVYKEEKTANDLPIMLPTMIGLSRIFMHRQQLDSAQVMAGQAYEIANQRGLRQDKKDACLLLANIYDITGRDDLGLSFYKRYVSLTDSIVSDQFRGQLYSFKRRAEDAAHASEVRALWTVLVILVLSAAFIFLVLMLRHKNDKMRLEQRSTNLEMQALRAQMNPHFIFNCLTAVNHFILNGDTEKASDYLTRFSRLIRLVLINSEKATVTLEEELALLKLYLDMEQLRFVNTFDYSIHYDDAIQPSMVNVPSFILQPFCENAIWHGLLHKDGKGKLEVELGMRDNIMICTITDNGIGLEKAKAMKAKTPDKQPSLGLRLTADRLAIFNGSKGRSGSFIIEEVRNSAGKVAGTRVILQIKT